MHFGPVLTRKHAGPTTDHSIGVSVFGRADDDIIKAISVDIPNTAHRKAERTVFAVAIKCVQLGTVLA